MPQPPRGVWGHVPPEINFLGHDSWGGKTEVRGGNPPFPRVLHETLHASGSFLIPHISKSTESPRKTGLCRREEVAPPISYNKATQQDTPTPSSHLVTVVLYS